MANLIVLSISTTAILVVTLLIARQFEKKSPIEPEQSTAEIILDWKFAGLRLALSKLLSPVTSVCTILLVNAAGGGWIHLRSDGWWLLPSFIVLVLLIDLYSYFLHLAQHKIPVLWAMHSLHHSAEALTVVTGARHFWLEGPLLTTAFPIMAIVFKIPPELATTVGIFYFVVGEGMAHLNLRVSLGCFTLWIQNPQFHRIHHSVEPQHRDRNFCKLLPLFDVLFGTAWKPGKDEFPATGLDTREKPGGVLDGLIWPIRHWLSPARSFVR
jgi:sterol desaturase/sphingolipid hydroxylase (fatty acid hydroxylase superfamily)